MNFQSLEEIDQFLIESIASYPGFSFDPNASKEFNRGDNSETRFAKIVEYFGSRGLRPIRAEEYVDCIRRSITPRLFIRLESSISCGDGDSRQIFAEGGGQESNAKEEENCKKGAIPDDDEKSDDTDTVIIDYDALFSNEGSRQKNPSPETYPSEIMNGYSDSGEEGNIFDFDNEFLVTENSGSMSFLHQDGFLGDSILLNHYQQQEQQEQFFMPISFQKDEEEDDDEEDDDDDDEEDYDDEDAYDDNYEQDNYEDDDEQEEVGGMSDVEYSVTDTGNFMQGGRFLQHQQLFIPLHFHEKYVDAFSPHMSRSLFGNDTSKISDMIDDDGAEDGTNGSRDSRSHDDREVVYEGSQDI